MLCVSVRREPLGEVEVRSSDEVKDDRGDNAASHLGDDVGSHLGDDVGHDLRKRNRPTATKSDSDGGGE